MVPRVWHRGQHIEKLRSDEPRCAHQHSARRRYSLDVFVGDRRFWPLPRGCRAYAGFATWAATASDDVLAQ
ncbi:hypothetical protein I551_8733 [Mycobacterium ulcerans str. Harvey]|uniref:Uncharacterized protein n=1 Tax=Mycobacterium ulcerans str. Harvey TaxID=1299332 RepID=A0ABN0RA46_MYCUL|nr:hypothetical protein I551_8733 [Mycobacterium ulcerans str. Harvey]